MEVKDGSEGRMEVKEGGYAGRKMEKKMMEVKEGSVEGRKEV